MSCKDDEVTWAGAAFDRAPSLLRHLIVVAKTPRAGSHLLGRLMHRLGLGIPLEYFNPKQIKPLSMRWGIDSSAPFFARDYLQALILRRTVEGVCTIHAGPRQFPLLAQGLDTWEVLPPLSFVHLWRRDSLAQAISQRLSLQSGFWDRTEEPTSPPAPHLDIHDLAALRNSRRWLLQEELLWRAQFRERRLPVVHVAYEDLVRNREGTLRQIVTTLTPLRAEEPWPELTEPNTPDTLWARQSLDARQRRALYQAYVDCYGPITPLPDP